ncbi:hypothetical protein FKW77_002155 [Venturia effusa]|uniref:F-box domain-containing protein n=1 Tax=Venturia effusa TaxID=50376 RepID=A0A517LEY6_9PEZI|nr:hypothetical protein FKW77_002155 [Venturia effusa]
MATPPIEIPKETRDVIKNPDKLAFLPASIRDVVPTLSRFQVKQLRGLFESHFDFLDLPLELRETIYELALCPGTSTTIVRRSHLPKAPARSCPNESIILPISLLKVCPQIQQEANNVLYRKYTAKLHITAYKKGVAKNFAPKEGITAPVMRGLILSDPTTIQNSSTGKEEEEQKSQDRGYRLKNYDIQPFLGFRKLHLVIQNHTPLHAFSYGDAQKGSLGYMVSEWVNMLVEQYHTQPSPTFEKQIHLEFRLDGRDTFLVQQFWTGTDAGRELLWFTVQARHVVLKMREELEVRSPNCNVVLTSNVETPDGFGSSRLSAEKVRFVRDNDLRGRILRLKEGKVVQELERRAMSVVITIP